LTPFRRVKTAQQRDAEGTSLATSDVNGSWSGAPPRGRSHVGRTKPARRSQWSESARLLAPVHHCLLPTSGTLMFSWILSDTLRSFWTVALALVQNLLRVSRSADRPTITMFWIGHTHRFPCQGVDPPGGRDGEILQLAEPVRRCCWRHQRQASSRARPTPSPSTPDWSA
jgi:hypothetical protein